MLGVRIWARVFFSGVLAGTEALPRTERRRLALGLAFSDDAPISFRCPFVSDHPAQITLSGMRHVGLTRSFSYLTMLLFGFPTEGGHHSSES